MALKTIEDIKNMAGNAKRLATAKKTAAASKWKQLGRDGEMLWGQAAGSRGNVYSTYVTSNRQECSCPSRQRPCKHALALLLMDVDDHDFPEAEAPSGHVDDANSFYNSIME